MGHAIQYLFFVVLNEQFLSNITTTNDAHPDWLVVGTSVPTTNQPIVTTEDLGLFAVTILRDLEPSGVPLARLPSKNPKKSSS